MPRGSARRRSRACCSRSWSAARASWSSRGADTSRPIAVGVVAGDRSVAALLPLGVELRADPDAVTDRAATLAAATVEKLVEAVGPGPPATGADLRLLAGDFAGRLVLAYPSGATRDAAEYTREALDEALRSIDRLRAPGAPSARRRTGGYGRPAPAHRRDPSAARGRGGDTAGRFPARRGLDRGSRAAAGGAAGAPGSAARAHEDQDPERRVMRRILQRLDGMGSGADTTPPSTIWPAVLPETSAPSPPPRARRWWTPGCCSRSPAWDSGMCASTRAEAARSDA